MSRLDLTPRVYGWLNRPADSAAPRYLWQVGNVQGAAETKEAALAAADAFLASEREREAARRAKREAISAAARRRSASTQEPHHAA